MKSWKDWKEKFDKSSKKLRGTPRKAFACTAIQPFLAESTIFIPLGLIKPQPLITPLVLSQVAIPSSSNTFPKKSTMKKKMKSCWRIIRDCWRRTSPWSNSIIIFTLLKIRVICKALRKSICTPSPTKPSLINLTLPAMNLQNQKKIQELCSRPCRRNS